MEGFEICGKKEIIAKRKKVFSTLNLEEVAVLKASENADGVAKDFDRIFLKLLRLIKYSTDRNNAEKSEIESNTNNLIKKLANYIGKKQIDRKIVYEQKAFFDDICCFINFFVDDTYLSTVHNSIPKISFENYNDKTVGGQLFQNMYARNRGMEGICEGGSCSHWTILLYNFFNKLKEAGLDIKIKFFRYKNLDDTIAGVASSQRHSGLIVNFQGEDYMVDHDGLIYDRSKSIARPITPYIDISERTNNVGNKEFFENFRYDNTKETDKVKFFDNIDDFISHCKKYPEYYKVALYAQFPGKNSAENLKYEFGEHSFLIGVDGEAYEYYLRDSNISSNKLLENMVKKVFLKRKGDEYLPITDNDRTHLKKYLKLVNGKIDLDRVYKNITSGDLRRVELVDFFGKKAIAVMQ